MSGPELPRSRGPIRPFVLAAAAIGLLLGGCVCTEFPMDGGLHRKGDRLFTVRAFTADPIVGRSLVWIGEADMPNKGVGLSNYWFPEDRVALGVAVNRTVYDTSRSLNAPYDRTWAWDFETRIRYYPVEVEQAALFLEVFGGYTRGPREFPPEGTRRNASFGGDAGLEIPLGYGVSLFPAIEFHHISNGRGRHASDNPSQNEQMFWAGIGIRW